MSIALAVDVVEEAARRCDLAAIEVRDVVLDLNRVEHRLPDPDDQAEVVKAMRALVAAGEQLETAARRLRR